MRYRSRWGSGLVWAFCLRCSVMLYTLKECLKILWFWELGTHIWSPYLIQRPDKVTVKNLTMKWMWRFIPNNPGPWLRVPFSLSQNRDAAARDRGCHPLSEQNFFSVRKLSPVHKRQERQSHTFQNSRFLHRSEMISISKWNWASAGSTCCLSDNLVRWHVVLTSFFLFCWGLSKHVWTALRTVNTCIPRTPC